MSTLTTNLKLNKPEGTEHYNVSIQNENMDKIDEFCGRTDNPHNVTKEQVGLSNVPNVTTNNQTPTFTIASSNKDLTSGENLSISFGKIAKAINSLISHLANTSNPHNTTASQVGLGNVPNLATNDLTPTYTEASSNTALVSGEKLSVSFGKLSKAVSSLISHLANVSNPHSVTATQVGLGNVDNVSTNNQKPTYTVASSNTALSSGETLSTALGKIAKAVNSLISHLADNVGHITSAERTKWNAKLDSSSTASKATADANGNNIANTYATKTMLTEHTGSTSNPHNVTASQISANATFGLLKNLNLLDWAMEQTTGGTFMVDALNVTGVPYEGYWRGILSVNSGAMDRGVLIFDGANEYFITTSSQSFKDQEWIKVANAKDCLSLTGGVLTGNLTIDKNTGAKALFGIDAGINCPIMMNMVDAGNTSLFLNAPNTDLQQAIRLRVVVGEDLKVYSVYGQHNKPVNTYVGTGVTRVINTGGVGNALLIHGSNGYSLFATPHGALCFFGNSITGFGSNSIKFADGVLTIGTANPASAYFNENGVNYTYQVL